MERTALALMLCLVGCGGAANATSPASQQSDAELTPAERRLIGCQARYLPEYDTTMVYLILPSDYVAGVVLPGDGWDGGCGRSDQVMVEAIRARDGLFVVAGFEPGATAPTDVAVFAQEWAASMRAQLVEDGHTIVTEQLQPRTESMFSYALATDIEGHRMLQYHTERFDPFPAGLFRVHYAYVGPDFEVFRALAPVMLEAAQRSHAIARSELGRDQ